ncbi:LytR/AlgR family response regulator transcription factor [Tenacibaculum jejuense]|uniref:Putative two component transcriptional regulator, LytTR family n=1 Tax=Tenacibaculum jejuense TaxID=584609 RepID=A0A238UDU6_9FLAO|nr:response regulator transcription factor [Tenacibaculum jejuense]SNR17373.1 putative two component transcriptional regulator, LytTR family [Tenacibaculum jejuense]
MNVYIVEDEIFQLEDLKISLEVLGHNCIGASDDPMETLDQIEKLKPDVILIDIHLQKRKSGIMLAEKIKRFYKTPLIYTTSAYDEATINEASVTKPVAYLTKPIKENDLKAALILASQQIESKIKDDNNREFFARHGNKLFKIDINSILYVHTDSKNYCSIITKDERKFSVRNSISGLLKTLNNDDFIQTHRSFLINWNYIKSFSESDQSIDLKHINLSIPVGRTYKSKILERLNII